VEKAAIGLHNTSSDGETPVEVFVNINTATAVPACKAAN
jgi:hypothetical protein